MATLAAESHEVDNVARQLASNVPVRKRVKKYAALNTKIEAAIKEYEQGNIHWIRYLKRLGHYSGLEGCAE